MASVTRPRPTPSPPATPFKTLGEVIKQLGGISADRVRMSPVPGTATERDLIRHNDREDPICELIDGVLVEKVMGQEESRLAALLIFFLVTFVKPGNLGAVFAPDGPMRLSPNQVRLPDVAFVRRERLRGLKNSKEAILGLSPDLAIEVLSKSNSRGEMERKLRDYFAAGCRLVWYVDPRKRAVRVYTSPVQVITFGEGETLDGGEVLPGFTLPLRDLFAELDA